MAESTRVARLDEVPRDTGLVVTVGRDEIALFRCGEQVYAMENICPHREGPIGDGDVQDCIVVCPWHAWEVDVRTGEVVDFPDMKARTYPVRIHNGEVYVET